MDTKLQNSFEGEPELGKTNCRSSLGLECCRTQWFSKGARTWKDELHIIFWNRNAVKYNGFEGGPELGKTSCRLSFLSWNAVKHNGFEGGPELGKTNCRSSLEAGML